MYICSLCSFADSRKREWEKHHIKTDHPQQVNIELEASFDASSGDESDVNMEDAFIGDNFEPPDDIEFPDIDPPGDSELPDIDPPDNIEDTAPTGIPPREEPGDEDDPDTTPSSQDPWFPFKSRAHFYLTVLYNGSHRRNFDVETLKAILDIFRIYVPKEEYFPSIDDIVNFKN